MVFVCMKELMLEHGQQQEYPSPATGDEEEVFRCEIIVWPSGTVHPRRFALPHSSKLLDTDLDQASLSFLGSGMPFYQFYTDF
jgi:hypothetical protein